MTTDRNSGLPEYVIALLIAGGYVTQAKVDEARSIALGVSDGPLPPPASIPAAEVQALVERWRNGLADEVSEADIAYNHAMKACADELAKLTTIHSESTTPRGK